MILNTFSIEVEKGKKKKGITEMTNLLCSHFECQLSVFKSKYLIDH